MGILGIKPSLLGLESNVQSLHYIPVDLARIELTSFAHKTNVLPLYYRSIDIRRIELLSLAYQTSVLPLNYMSLRPQRDSNPWLLVENQIFLTGLNYRGKG